MIVEPNWGAFAAKFDGKEQSTFEWLSYLLFCIEHDRPSGIFRYFNQAAIETDPIESGGKQIGWQAKFTSSNLSAYEAVLIKSLSNAKLQNPEIDCLYFYLNKDFTSSSKKGEKEPLYKSRIEDHASSLGIAVVWKTASFFESPFVCEQNAKIAHHFFSAQRGLYEFHLELARHTRAILDPIDTAIDFQGTGIELDRSAEIEKTNSAFQSNQLVVISGSAGAGKTALVKKLKDLVGSEYPFFVLKASEFNVSNANDILRSFGNFSLSELDTLFDGITEKYLVIDSAERLGDLEYPEIFSEFLGQLLSSNWRIVLTTRLGYLQDLTYSLVETFRRPFETVSVNGLTESELVGESEQHGFELPSNARLLEVLQNPFYLSMYLDLMSIGERQHQYEDFKTAIWNRQIAKSSNTKNNMHRRREECFIRIAQHRANSGKLYVQTNSFQEELAALELDEIVSFDTAARGYFITHDIYEEWALERYIESTFIASVGIEEFFSSLGNSLAIRRSYRAWAQEKSVSRQETVTDLLESAFENHAIGKHWRDECIVSSLLSKDPSTLIAYLQSSINAQAPQDAQDHNQTESIPDLERTLFLLCLTCKQVDGPLLNNVLGKIANQIDFEYLFTRPVGNGWEALIKFLYDNHLHIGFSHVELVVNVLGDWSSAHKSGTTTRSTGLLALKILETMSTAEHWHYETELSKKLTKIVISCAHEVTEELTTFFLHVRSISKSERSNVFDTLIETVLGSILESGTIAKAIPEVVIELARAEWVYTPPEYESRFGHFRGYDIEQYFNLETMHQQHYPSSAYQTPTLALLRIEPKKTVDFILEFTNNCIESFSKSEIGPNELVTIDIVLDEENERVSQLSSDRIWNMYRGTQVAPKVLESMHMALEKWLLDVAKKYDPDVVSAWCKYLITKSKSSSVTAVVASVIQAYPDKYFEIAKILFRTKEVFWFDFTRRFLDQTADQGFRMAHDPLKIFINERLETCEDKHRQHTLEDLVLRYQLFREADVSEESANKRASEVWAIIDKHYQELERPTTADAQLKWRMSLARMDRRKMEITTKQVEGGTQLEFHPELEPELKEFSESGQKEFSSQTRYLGLVNWAKACWRDGKSAGEKHPQYQNDVTLVIREVKEILNEFEKSEVPDESFVMYYLSAPIYAYAVLLRDSSDKLDQESRNECAELLFEAATSPLALEYEYQFGDGVEAATALLPMLFKEFPDLREDISLLMLCLLLNNYSMELSKTFSAHIAMAISSSDIWELHTDSAGAVFTSFLKNQPKFEKEFEAKRLESFNNESPPLSFASAMNGLLESDEKNIRDALNAPTMADYLTDLGQYEGAVLLTALQILPNKPPNQLIFQYACEITKEITNRIQKRSDEDEELRVGIHAFYNKVANISLNLREEDALTYLAPLRNSISRLEDRSSLFDSLITVQDRVQNYELFWAIWDSFYDPIQELSQHVSNRHSNSLIHSFLLAWPFWAENIKSWHSVKNTNKEFFSRVSKGFGGPKSTLYGISKFLNEVGADFLEDGVGWLSNIIRKANEAHKFSLETNTLYYLEAIGRRVQREHRLKVKTHMKFREDVLTLLNFMVDNGSVAGYMLREDLL